VRTDSGLIWHFPTGWKIYGELWKADAASLGRMSPVFLCHSGTLSGRSSEHFSLPIWRYLVSYVTCRDVLDASGHIVFVKAQLIAQKNTAFSGFYWGHLRRSYFSIILCHLSKVPQVKSIISKRIYRVCAFVNWRYTSRRSKHTPKTCFELRSLRCILSIIVTC